MEENTGMDSAILNIKIDGYPEAWSRCTGYCFACGAAALIVESERSSHDHGNKMICMDCGTQFHTCLIYQIEPERGDQYARRLAAIRAARGS